MTEYEMFVGEIKNEMGARTLTGKEISKLISDTAENMGIYKNYPEMDRNEIVGRPIARLEDDGMVECYSTLIAGEYYKLHSSKYSKDVVEQPTKDETIKEYKELLYENFSDRTFGKKDLEEITEKFLENKFGVINPYEKAGALGTLGEVVNSITDNAVDPDALFETELRKLKPKKKSVREYLRRFLGGDEK